MDMKRVYSLKIDDELWREMKRHSYINWSEFIREAIRRKLSEEERRRVGYAVKLHMEILSKLNESDSDITEIIRRFREMR